MLLRNEQWRRDEVFSVVRSEVEGGENELRRVTMDDVAERVGVTRATVSMALRNYHRIPFERRQEIKRVAREIGFVPDPYLSALVAHRRQRVVAKDHGVLAWINKWKSSKTLRRFQEFDLYWQGACKAAATFGYRLDEIIWTPDCSPERLEQILLARGIEGVLLPPHRDLVEWGDFDWNKFSVVRFGLSVPNPDSNVVTSDTYRGTVMAISKIHEMGYKRIGVTVNEEYNRRMGGNFLSGFFYAQAALGLKPSIPPLLTFLKERTTDELARQKAALEVWLKEYQPDAILNSDIEIPGMIKELGYSIPEDIAVAGTTVLDIPGVDAGIDQQAEAIGRTAVETLIKQMNLNERGEPEHPCRILVESRWKEGISLPPASLRGEIWIPPIPVASAAGETELKLHRVTLQDVATKMNVSKNTVSIALRNSPRIRTELRERIQHAAVEMGYVVDPILQRLGAYRRNGGKASFQSVIAWLNHWSAPEKLRKYREFEQYWQGAKFAAKRLGYQLEEFVWPADCTARQAEQMLLERGVLGLLIPPHKPDVDWGDFDWSKFSLMRFGLSVRQVDADLVTADHQRAMVMAIKKIYDYGYGRIGLVYDGAHDRSMGGNLYGGFLWTHKLLQFKCLVPPLDIDLQVSLEIRKQKLKSWMQEHRPDAILTAIPETPGILKELNYRIPEDIAVAGTSVHDIKVDAGINQCPHAIGKIAAEMLIKQINLNGRGEPPNPCRILVESKWHDGGSMPSKI